MFGIPKLNETDEIVNPSGNTVIIWAYMNNDVFSMDFIDEIMIDVDKVLIKKNDGDIIKDFLHNEGKRSGWIHEVYGLFTERDVRKLMAKARREVYKRYNWVK